MVPSAQMLRVSGRSTPRTCSKTVRRAPAPANVTLRQDAILGPLDNWLFRKFDARHLAQTIDELAAAAKLPPAPVDGPDGEAAARIADCDRKLTGYRAALDAGGDPAVISRWITETTAERARLVARTPGEAAGAHDPRADRIRRHGARRHPGRSRRREPGGQGRDLQPGEHIVRAEEHLSQTPHWYFDSVRGGT